MQVPAARRRLVVFLDGTWNHPDRQDRGKEEAPARRQAQGEATGGQADGLASTPR